MKIDETELIDFFSGQPVDQMEDEDEIFKTTAFVVQADGAKLTVSFCVQASDVSVTISQVGAGTPVYTALHRDIEEVEVRERMDGKEALRIVSGRNVVFIGVDPILVHVKERV